MKRENPVKKPVLPIYVFGLSWLIYALFLPLFRYYHYVFALFSALTPAFICQLVITKGQSSAVIYDPALEDQGRAKDIMLTAQKQLSEIKALLALIEDDYIAGHLQRVVEIAELNLKIILQNPELLSRDRRFISFYLPFTLKLLNIHKNLIRQAETSGSSLKLSRLEGMLDEVYLDFERQAVVLNGGLPADFSHRTAQLEARFISSALGKECAL